MKTAHITSQNSLIDLDVDWSVPQICLFVGKPHLGKTHLLKSLVQEQLEVDDPLEFGVCFTNTSWEVEYSWLPEKSVIDGWDTGLFVRWITFLKETAKTRKLPRNFIILDDLVGILDNSNTVMLNFFCNHRHYNTSIFLSVQYLKKGVSPTLRECTTIAFLFGSSTENTMKALHENFGQLFDDYKSFKTHFQQSTSRTHQCMVFLQHSDQLENNYFSMIAHPDHSKKIYKW